MARRGIHVDVFDDLGVERPSPLDGSVYIVELEPYQHPVTVPSPIGVDEVRVVLHVPGVELERQHTVHKESVVAIGVVRRHQLAGARRTQERPVPPGARSHVADGEQGLRAD